jgi:BirA family biotin operon repressor/biotin-[acetyl-CoA-carboxylase] ligase
LNNFKSKTQFIGKELLFLPSCHSTNEYAKNLVKNQTFQHGQIVITQHQTAGKGQMGSSWEAAPGENLTFSIIYTPQDITIAHAFLLTQSVSCAIVDYLALLGIPAKIKWPNDIYIQDQKVAGILIENIIQGQTLKHCIIGIGLNVNQKKFEYPKAISMAQFKNNDFDLEQILQLLVEHIEKELSTCKSNDSMVLKNKYLSYLYKYKEKHLFSDSKTVFEGIIEGVNEDGTLNILQVKNQQKVSYSLKEVRFL